MRTKIKIVAPVQDKKVVESALVSYLLANALLSETLAAHMETWKLLGNKWLTSIEADLEINAKNVKVEGGINLNALRSLEFMGYMVKTDLTFAEGWCIRYKLSKKGLKAVGMSETETEVSTSAEVECSLCDGTGQNDAGAVCGGCDGEGVAKQGRGPAKRRLGPVKVAPVLAPTVPKQAAMVDCPECDGTGMTGYRKCLNCAGQGEITIPTRKATATSVPINSKKFEQSSEAKRNQNSWNNIKSKPSLKVRRK